MLPILDSRQMARALLRSLWAADPSGAWKRSQEGRQAIAILRTAKRQRRQQLRSRRRAYAE